MIDDPIICPECGHNLLTGCVQKGITEVARDVKQGPNGLVLGRCYDAPEHPAMPVDEVIGYECLECEFFAGIASDLGVEIHVAVEAGREVA